MFMTVIGGLSIRKFTKGHLKMTVVGSCAPDTQGENGRRRNE